jgi:diguanylate cyclase (GGDEF)-like protein/PAS domain S-box-containing protein
MTYSRWLGPDRPVSNGSVVTRLRLESNKDAPQAARVALGPLRGEIEGDVLERAELLTSELVSNSVKYGGGGDIRVDIWRAAGTVAVVVSDDGPGFTPVARDGIIAEMDGGFGLPLIDLLSNAWGNGTGGDSWVWFEVAPRIVSVPNRERMSDGDELLDIRMAVESIKNHALLTLDNDGNVTGWGSGPESLTGFTADELLGRHVSELFMPASKSAFSRDREHAETQGWHRSERWIRCRDDTPFWAEVDLAPIRDRSLHQRGLSMLISDLTARKRESDAREHLIVDLRKQALTDEVTGLANRRHWMQVLRRELARAGRQETELAIAMLDLDQFKAYNDAHGHPAGDDLLRAVARRWGEAVRSSDVLARYGGDEFAITLPECRPEIARDVVARIADAAPTAIVASAGIAFARPGDTAESLVERADSALYAAKATGHDSPVVMAALEDDA